MSLNSALNVFNLQLNDSALALVLLSLKKFSIQFFVLTSPQSVIRISPCRTAKRIPNDRLGLKESVLPDCV